MHRREVKDKKKSQINDTFFAESYKNAKYAKVFPSRFAIMPDMTTKKYSQNMIKGGSRFNETPSISAKSVPADNIEKMDRNDDDHLFEDSQKLREFTTLVRKYYSDFNAD